LLVLALGCGGVAQQAAPTTEAGAPGSSSGGRAETGAGEVSAGGALGNLMVPPEGGGPSAPPELAQCPAQPGAGCESDRNYLQIQDLRSDGGQLLVELNWPGGANCGTCTAACEVCEFSCEIRAQAVKGCGELDVYVAARSGESGTAYLDTISADPHYVDLTGKRWRVLSLLALNPLTPAADAELVDWDLSLDLSDGALVRTLPVHAHFCASTEWGSRPCVP